MKRLTPREKLIRRILREGTITHEAQPEDYSYHGNCSAIDPVTDRAQEQWISDQLDGGNEWAWCSVKTTIVWQGHEHSIYLGGCSYLSHANWLECSGHDQARECAYALRDRKIAGLPDGTPTALRNLMQTLSESLPVQILATELVSERASMPRAIAVMDPFQRACHPIYNRSGHMAFIVDRIQRYGW